MSRPIRETAVAAGITPSARRMEKALKRRDRPPGRSIWITPEAIYGTILTSAILSASADNETDAELLVTVLSGAFVLWGAHVFAIVMARHGAKDGHETGIREATREAAFHSAGFLLAPAPQILTLFLGAVNVLPDWLALAMATVLGIVVLFVLGIVACIERRKPWYLCLLAGFVTGFLGMFVVIMKAAFE